MEINIKFNKEQYKNLLELIYLGNWLANGHKKPSEFIKKYKDIENYIASFALDYDLSSIISYDDEQKSYSISDEIEDELYRSVIEDHNNFDKKRMASNEDFY